MSKILRLFLIGLFCHGVLITGAGCALKSSSASEKKQPTAIIVDAKDGKPVEGAVAIAIWWSTANVGMIGGGSSYFPDKIVEVVTDKDGKIYIDGFWDWHLVDCEYPRLTVYKCGYTCWDQHDIYQGRLVPCKDRTDFDEEHRIVRLDEWPEKFTGDSHYSFIYSVTHHKGLYSAKDKLFRNAYLGCKRESELRKKERIELWEKTYHKKWK